MKHRVAIIGAGIGAAHLGGFAKVSDRFTVKTLCDIDLERADVVAREHSNVSVVTELADVLADPKIDIVDICLPPHLHFDACIKALYAGKHVICEKPLVTSLRDADTLADHSAKTGKNIFPVFQYRYGLGTAQLRALVDAGLAGRCYAGSLETHWDRPASYYDTGWRGTWAGEQGGALLGHAIHIHDLLSAILGPVAQVFADTTTRVNDIEVEDCATLAIRMQCGARITSSVTLGCAGNLSRLRLMFEGFTVESDHAAYAPAERAWRFTARAPTTQDQLDQVLSRVPAVANGYAGLFEAIADALEGSPGREVTLAEGRRSLEFVTASYASARQNAPMTLPFGTDHPLYTGWTP